MGHSLGGLYFQYFARRYPEATFIMVEGDNSIRLHSPEGVIQQIKQLSKD